jgi:serine/threonine protein kinase
MPVNFILKTLQAKTTQKQNSGAAAEKPQEPASVSPINPNQNEGGGAKKPQEIPRMRGGQIPLETGIAAFNYFFPSKSHTQKVISKLGTGGFGAVFGNTENANVVVKIQQDSNSAKNEFQTLNFLFKQANKNQHLLNMFNATLMTFQGLNFHAFLLPRMEMDFHDYLSAKKRPDQVIQDIFIGALKGLEHLHGLGILHRDLKPENILVNTSQNGRKIGVLCDFGFATSHTETDKLKQLAGTYVYTPPLLIPVLIKTNIAKLKIEIDKLNKTINSIYLAVSIEGKEKTKEIPKLKVERNYYQEKIETLTKLEEFLTKKSDSKFADHEFNVKDDLYMIGLVALVIFINHYTLPHFNNQTNKLNFTGRFKAVIPDSYQPTHIDSEFKAALYDLIRKQVCTKPQYQLPSIKAFREKIETLS